MRPRLVSAVYDKGPAAEPTGQVAEERSRAVRAAAWHKLGLAIMDPAEIDDEWLRLAVTNFAERAYGRRGRR